MQADASKVFKGPIGMLLVQLNRRLGNSGDGDYAPVGSSVLPASGTVTTNSVGPTRWVRMGNTIRVEGTVTVTVTTAGTREFRLTIPVPMDITNTNQLSGIAVNSTNNTATAIRGSTSTDQATFVVISSDTAPQTISYSYSYKVP